MLRLLRGLLGSLVRRLIVSKRLPRWLRERLRIRYHAYLLLRRPPGTLLDQAEFRAVLRKVKTTLSEEVGVALEFGTFAGDSLVETCGEFPRAAKFAFDSFQGLPEGADTEHGDWHVGQFCCPFPITVRNMKRQGVDPFDPKHQIQFVKGWFSETCTPSRGREISAIGEVQFVMVDCDLQSACDEVLAFVSPLLAPRSVIVYDDWGSNNPDEIDVGIKASHSDWLAKNPHLEATELARYPQNGIAFVIETTTPR